MLLSADTFLTHIKSLVTGKQPVHGGFLVEDQSVLASSGEASVGSAVTLGASGFVIPRDYDEASDELKLHVTGRMGGGTDTPALSVAVTRTRVGVGDSTIQTSTTVLTLSNSYQEDVLDLSGNGLKRGDYLDIAVQLAAHSTDAAGLLSARPIYRSCLVSYHTKDADGNALR